MSPSTLQALRWIDAFFGIPMCWISTGIRRIGSVFHHASAQQPRKLLIIKLSEMGGTVLAYPALLWLRQQHPQLQVYFLVFEENRPILDALRLGDSFHIVPLRTHGFAAVSDVIHAAWTLTFAGIDATIDMDFFSRFATLFAYFTCRGKRIGFVSTSEKEPYRGDLLTHRVAYNIQVHTSVSFLSLAQALGQAESDAVIDSAALPVTPEMIPQHTVLKSTWTSVQEKLNALPWQTTPRRLVLINPNSSHLIPLRKWPRESFVALCRGLLDQERDVHLILTGAPGEKEDAQWILNRISSPRAASLAGETSFTELLALHAVSDLLVTNDSGPAHYATLTRLPTIVIFGPETPKLYVPLGEQVLPLYADFACSPCVSAYNAKHSLCDNNLCVQAISPERVLTEALKSLRATPSRRSA